MAIDPVRLPRQAAVILALVFAAVSCSDPGEPEPAKGSLSLAVSGLPDTIPAAISLTGPNGYSKQVTRGETLTGLVPGTYTVATTQVRTNVATFVPASSGLTVTVGANSVSQAAVIYSITTGMIAVTVSGVPTDIPWKVVVIGPGGYKDSTSSNRTLGNLVPGIYTATTTDARRDPNIYAPSRAELVLTVTASITPVPATFGFFLTSGSLTLQVNGVPGGASANISITGPGGFSRTATGSATFEALVRGVYVVSASGISSGNTSLTPSPTQQNVTVAAGATSIASVNYWPATFPPGLNLGIDAVHVQQVVQTYGGAVPLVAGRDALLRVFVRASEPNVASPAVRVRLYDGALLLATSTIPAPTAGVPTTIDESNLGASWNLAVAANLVRPGLRVLVDVDPSNAFVETNETDNTWPSVGTPLALDVRTASPLLVRLVPVTQTATGLTGEVTTASTALFADLARKLLPINALTIDVRQPYTSNGPPLVDNDVNLGWGQLLSELNALRTAEGSQAHYYGVVKTTYTFGVAGISYLPSFVSVGWDKMPHAIGTFVHELGHNFGRLHSRSCGAGGPDASYPYANGAIGVFGYDIATGSLLGPSTPDIMGYCDDRWISDYTYAGILAFRAAQTQTAAATALEVEDGLLLWGRITAKGVILEPAYQVHAPPSLPTASGPHRLEIIDRAGRVLTGFSFRGGTPAEGASSDEEHFAFVVPLRALNGALPDRIRLSSGTRRAELTTSRRSTDQITTDFAPVVQRVSRSRVRVRWADAPGRGVLVRDPRTGTILSFARGGRAEVTTTLSSLDLTFSDGVRSARRTVLVR